WPPKAFRTCDRPLSPGKFLLLSSRHDDQRRISVTNIPFRPLRARNFRGIRTAIFWGLYQRKHIRNSSRLASSPRRTPSATIQPEILRHPKRRLIHPRLPAGNDSHGAYKNTRSTNKLRAGQSPALAEFQNVPRIMAAEQNWS